MQLGKYCQGTNNSDCLLPPSHNCSVFRALYTLFAVVRLFDHRVFLLLFLIFSFFLRVCDHLSSKHKAQHIYFIKRLKKSETCCFVCNPKPHALVPAPTRIVPWEIFSPLFEAPLCLRPGSHFTQTNPDETQSLVPTSTIDLVFGKQILLVQHLLNKWGFNSGLPGNQVSVGLVWHC